jgi:hypothetical protein
VSWLAVVVPPVRHVEGLLLGDGEDRVALAAVVLLLFQSTLEGEALSADGAMVIVPPRWLRMMTQQDTQHDTIRREGDLKGWSQSLVPA